MQKQLQEALDVFLTEQQGEGSEPFLCGWQLVKLLRACNPSLFLWQKKDRIHAYLHKFECSIVTALLVPTF